MAMRMAEAPTGGARISYGVLATVLAALGGALVATVAWPIVTTEQTCATDPTGLCTPALGLLLATIAFWLVLAWLASAFRLGRLFVLMVVVGQLVCGQLAIEWVSAWPLPALILVVPLAAWLSSPGPLLRPRIVRAGRVPEVPRSGVPRRRLLAVVGVCAILVGQLAVWAWTFLR